MMRTERVAIVGAGAGGICAAKHLLARGLDVTVFEMGSHVGGLWVYDNDNGRSPAYAALHINSEPAVTHYPDFPFPPDTPLFPTHEQVRAYLDAYADRFGVRERVRFNTRVTSVRPMHGDPAEGWTVSPEGEDDEHFDAVVVASGHQGIPAHPPFAEDFAGEYLHSRTYRTADPFRGKRVLVVGVGNSGLDIAADVSTVAAETIVAIRSPVLIMPRMMFGVPTSRILGKLKKSWIPWPVQHLGHRALSWIAHGRMERWGMRTPTKPTHPASNATFMPQLFYGRIRVRPGIAAVHGQEVHFTDGTSDVVDTMIAATGYEIDLPFLAKEIAPIDGRRLDAYKRVVHPDLFGLYFVGFFNVSGGANIRMMDVQARWVAMLATGAAGLPDRAGIHADIEAERRMIARRYPDAPRYGLELDPLEYPRDIDRELRRAPSDAPSAPRRTGALHPAT